MSQNVPLDGGQGQDSSERRRRRLVVAGIAAVLSVIALVAGLVLISGDGDEDAAPPAPPTTLEEVTDAVSTAPVTTVGTTVPATPAPATSEATTTTTTDPGFVQGPGEVFLEAADAVGPDSFTGEVFADVVPPVPIPTTVAPTPTTVATPTTGPGPSVVAAASGNRPGLYGGSRDNAVCVKEAQVGFLERNPEKAAAFVMALNGDPTLRWSGGTSLEVSQIRAYFDELTPMILTRDTRVTNHGFRDGLPTSRQVVLQAGTAVLVDAYGVPRARCLCGNPLTRPQPVQVTPVYTGPRWPDFDPTVVIVVQPTTVVIDVFVLIDIITGNELLRPAGSDGSIDVPWQVTTWQIDIDATWLDVGDTTQAAWSGTFTIADDGTISGSGRGTWTFEGDCRSTGGDLVSITTGQGTFDVALGGEAVTTELGRFLTIQPVLAGLQVGSIGGDPPSADCEGELAASIDSWVDRSFTPVEGIQVDGELVLATYESNGYIGGLTLTPLF